MGFYSRVVLVFVIKGSKKRREKQPGKLMGKSRSQPVNLPGALPSMNPLYIPSPYQVASYNVIKIIYMYRIV